MDFVARLSHLLTRQVRSICGAYLPCALPDGSLITYYHREAQKEVQNISLDTNFSIPGDPGFPLNQMFEAPQNRQDAEILKQYLMQVRQELAQRLLARIYEGGQDLPSKWWLSFTKRKFMGKSL